MTLKSVVLSVLVTGVLAVGAVFASATPVHSSGVATPHTLRPWVYVHRHRHWHHHWHHHRRWHNGHWITINL